MPKVLMVFLDGVGLGEDDPRLNPLAAASMPAMRSLLGERPLVQSSAPFEGPQATLLALDASLGVEGMPQSATGQAAILTGRNVPAEVGEHYGPKPNPAVADIVRRGSLFSEVRRRGGTAVLLNAYPPGYFESIESGRRLYSCIPLAATSAGIALLTAEDLQRERALSADFTGEGWALQPGFPRSPIYSPSHAGRQLARLAAASDLAWFDFWASDYAGHKGIWDRSIALLESFDGVLGGVVEAYRDRNDLVVLTSDHGNLEDSARRGHTLNPVPALMIGPLEARRRFTEGLSDLTGFYAAILKAIFGENASHPPSPPRPLSR
jgi:2,3-bisphosphoglycerate-independent phosphoglycerate mutase